MEGADGTRRRLLVVLALVAGLLVGGSSVVRTGPLRALAATPAAAPAVPVAHAAGSAAPQRTASRTAGSERAAVAAPSTTTSCAGASGACPLAAAAGLPEQRGALTGRLSGPPAPAPAAPAGTRQDRAPPGPAGP